MSPRGQEGLSLLWGSGSSSPEVDSALSCTGQQAGDPKVQMQLIVHASMAVGMQHTKLQFHDLGPGSGEWSFQTDSLDSAAFVIFLNFYPGFRQRWSPQ